MKVTLLHNSPLEVIVKAIRKCYASEGKSDSGDIQGHLYYKWMLCTKDKALIKRIIESEHTSTLEHLSFTFDIDGLSRAALQELVTHRHASRSTKSTRYTLGELKKHKCLCNIDTGCMPCGIEKFLVHTGEESVDDNTARQLCLLRMDMIRISIPNDKAKYMLPEAFKTSLVWTINARSLRNFLNLRSSKKALWEMRELAKEVFEKTPEDMKFIFEECMEVKDA